MRCSRVNFFLAITLRTYVIFLNYLPSQMEALETLSKIEPYIDMAKRAGRVGFWLGQSSYGSNGSQVETGCESGWVDPYFSKKKFFFFEVDAICQLFISFLTVTRFSLVILLPITTKHLTWYPNSVQLLFQLSRS